MLMRFRCPESEMPYAIDIDFAVLLLQLLARLIALSFVVVAFNFPDESVTAQRTSQRATAGASLSQPHPFGVQDMVRMDRLGAPIPSPDGQRIVFTVRSWDASSNQATTNLWIVSSDGRIAATHGGEETGPSVSPAWSPDSRTVAFVSNRSGSQRSGRSVWRREARQMTSFPLDVDNLRWSPVGSHIALSTEVYPDADMAATARRDKAGRRSVKAMKFDRLFIRHWDTWADGKRNHIFVCPCNGERHRHLEGGRRAHRPHESGRCRLSGASPLAAGG